LIVRGAGVREQEVGLRLDRFAPAAGLAGADVRREQLGTSVAMRTPS
jgi:hypothetical protein